jgi:hypothetical protein
MYQKECDSRSAQKVMFTVIWGVEGFHVVDLMTSQCSFNSEYFVSHVLAPIVVKVFPQGRIPRTRRLQLHLDNCRLHLSKTTKQFITENHDFESAFSDYFKRLQNFIVFEISLKEYFHLIISSEDAKRHISSGMDIMNSLLLSGAPEVCQVFAIE